ncbi:MAG: YraN family protein [Exilispira sp.]
MQSETQNDIKLSKREIGYKYEKIAREYLIKNGYLILENNIYTRFGEIDILAKKGNNYYIIEVKGGIKREEIFERFSKSKLRKLLKLTEFISLKYNSEFVFTDGIIISTMEGRVTITYIENILQQGC